MFLLPFFLAWFLSFVLWEEQLQNIKLERIFHQYQSFLFFFFVSCLALSFRSPFLILSYYYLNLCFCWTRKFYVSKEASYKHQSRNNHNNCKRGKRNLMKKHQKRKNRITIRFRRSRWRRRRRKTTKTIMKMMLKMQKINKAGKVVVNYLSTLHLSPKQFVLEVLLKIPNFWKTSKKKHVGRRESPHQAPRWFRSKLAQNASRYFTASSTCMWRFEAMLNPTTTPAKPFRASFPQKTAEHAKETVCRCTNFVQISKTTPTRTPLFFMISTFQHNHRKRVPIKGFCFELRFRRNRAKNANWKIQFSRKTNFH